jgi:heptosyltransferase-1
VAPYCVLLHSTARAAKHWSEDAWIELGRGLEARGAVCLLPWGNETERRRAARIAGSLGRAVVPPRLSLMEALGLVGHASAVIGVDTGLMHFAAAFRTPVVGIYCDSEPSQARPLGAGPTAARGGIGKPPSAAEVLAAFDEVAPATA